MSREPVTMTLPSEVIEQLDAEAQSQFRSRSSLATQLIAQGLESKPKEAEQRASRWICLLWQFFHNNVRRSAGKESVAAVME